MSIVNPREFTNYKSYQAHILKHKNLLKFEVIYIIKDLLEN